MTDQKTLDASCASRLSGKLERKLKKDLQQLSNAVLVYLHQVDNLIANDKTIPFRAGSNLAKLSNWLEMNNDMTRRFSLNLDEDSAKKEKAAKKLMRSNVKLRGRAL